MTSCDVGSNVCRALVSGGLEVSKTLRELDLRHNAIGPEGAKRLIAMLEKKNFVLAVGPSGHCPPRRPLQWYFPA